MKLEFSRQIFR